MRINRRQLIVTGAAGGVGWLAGAASARAERMAETPVPAESLAATPVPDGAEYAGPLGALWDAPWNVEGRRLSFNGVILHRAIAPAGEAYETGVDGLLFRSHLLLEVQVEGGGARELVVATNNDLSGIAGRYTVHVVGSYGGTHRFHDPSVNGVWTRPLVIASVVEPAAPDATLAENGCAE